MKRMILKYVLKKKDVKMLIGPIGSRHDLVEGFVNTVVNLQALRKAGYLTS